MLPERSYDDFDPILSNEAVQAIGRVTLSWSRFDSFLTQWIANEARADFTVCYILVGRLDVRQKLGKLSALFKLTHQKEKKELVTTLVESQEKPAETRHLIAHGLCLGSYKNDPRYLGYVNLSKAVSTKKKSQVPIAKVPIAHLMRTAEAIDNLTAAILGQLPPSEAVPPSPLFPILR